MSHLRPRLAAGIAIVVAGCSAARYDADYAKAVERHRSEAPFAVLQEVPAEFAAGRLMARLPQGFGAVVAESTEAAGEPAARLDPSRLRPPFLDALAGYEGTFERRLPADAAEVPVSLAAWRLPAADGSRAALEKSLLDKARGDNSFTNAPAWVDRQVVPRAGGPAAWRVLQLSGPQLFESVVAGNQEYKRWDSTCELWLAADPTSDVRPLLVWRVPAVVAGQLPVPLAELAETVARTVTIRPPAAADEAATDATAPAPARAAPAGSEPAAGF